MFLKIFLDLSNNKIIKMEPAEEFSGKLGDTVNIGDTNYSIMKIEIEEFIDWELIVVKIEISKLNKLKEGN